MPQIIITSSSSSIHEAVRELRACNAKLTRWLLPGVGLASTEGTWDVTSAAFITDPPIWIRHVHPVQASGPLYNDARDLMHFEALIEPALMELDTAGTFSVQVRLLGEEIRWQYSRFDVSERLAAHVMSWGAELDVRDPFQVLSVTCSPNEVFIGLSRAQDNLSNWAGGERRFRREPDQISRAEFKLLEALETFRIDLPASGTALDLGAAPGGWTRLLAGKGLNIVAVDPAELDPRAAALRNVRHIRKMIQETKFSEKFDMVLNDMRMDARDAARILVSLADHLKPGGIVISTLKLPETHTGETAAAALEILKQRFVRLGARQLFHNRSEITVALSVKE